MSVFKAVYPNIHGNFISIIIEININPDDINNNNLILPFFFLALIYYWIIIIYYWIIIIYYRIIIIYYRIIIILLQSIIIIIHGLILIRVVLFSMANDRIACIVSRFQVKLSRAKVQSSGTNFGVYGVRCIQSPFL